MQQVEHTPVGAAQTSPPEPACSERRRDARFAVGGARVGVEEGAFAPEGAFVAIARGRVQRLISGAGAGLQDVKDLSCGGLRFETTCKYEVGQVLTLSLHVREWSEPVRLRAEVRWVRPVYVDMLDAVGVQFRPFDGSRAGNPPEAREAIAALEARYAPATAQPAAATPAS